MWVKRAATAVALAAVVWGTVPGLASADPETPAPSPPATPTTSPAATPTTSPPSTADTPGTSETPPPATPMTSIDADGTYAVGTDIVPGVYTSAGPVTDGTCSWRRLGNPDGATLDSAMTHKAQVVQIDPTDQAFKTRGCQTWTLNNDAAPAPVMSPALAGLKLQAYMAQLNAQAAISGQMSPPAAAPAPPAAAPAPPAAAPAPPA